MQRDVIFIPLWGGQKVGASCYYLKIGDENIILDAGIGKEKDIEFEPNFYTLLSSQFIQSINQINKIFISHAHIDHVGYLLKLMKQATFADVYMTPTTKILVKYQLYERLLKKNENIDENSRLAIESLLERIVTVNYMDVVDFGKYKVTFYAAGHMPGAMMVLFELKKKKILYTGDYSLEGTPLTQGCFIPKNKDIDDLIICGLHAKHPNYQKKSDNLFKQIYYMLNSVRNKGEFILCNVSQLSKGVEFVTYLNEANKDDIPIYIDSSIMDIVEKMEKLHIPILDKNNKIIGNNLPNEPHIVITSSYNKKYKGKYKVFKVDFSLHEDFEEMKKFIKLVNSKQAVVVHCAKEKSVFDNTIEQEMMYDSECRTQFIFPEEGDVYKL